ncbi:hypothetical protein EF834_13620 [Rhodococcus spongiicola]|uniref:Uncharacterized protein n=1 Tax=Rhodococcus spongiicola TaxID=2487352 RepID=A0A3S3A7M8_9NOCA|nr:hypothetical protein EF834_13620 [Rhodococcus spongiicola]
MLHGARGTWKFRAYLSSLPYFPYDDLSWPRKILHDFLRPVKARRRYRSRRSLTIYVKTRWAACPSCRQYRSKRRALSLALTAPAALVLISPLLPLTDSMPEGSQPLLVFPGLVLAITAAKSVSTIWELTRAEIPVDGTELVVRNPHPEFAREALALGARQLPEMVTPVGWWKRREPL